MWRIFKRTWTTPVQWRFSRKRGMLLANQIWPFATGVFQKFGERMADDFLKSCADQVGEAAIGGANFTVESDRHQHIVKRIDQVAVTLL